MNTYEERLNEIKCAYTEDIIEMCKRYVPNKYTFCPWKHPGLNHGINLLQNDNELDCYMAAYGEMHLMKCKTALQNLPYDQLKGSIEIVDWGCGQGIGTMSIIDALKDRNQLSWLKKVTLIEASTSAIERAEANVSLLTENCVEIDPINKYLPDVTCTDNRLNDLGYRCSFIIHIFSNILDIKSVDIVKIAKLIGSRGTHIILCVGPVNSASYRIKQFCSIFGEQDYFSQVDSPAFSKTQTGHPFSCMTRCFVYNGNPLDYDKINTIKPNDEPIYTDYDLELQIQNNIISIDKARIAYRLNNILVGNDLIYYHPQINEVSMDFIVIRPNKGIIILNIFGKDIKDYHFAENKTRNVQKQSLNHQEIDEKKKLNKNILVHNETDEELQSPLSLINICQSSIIDSVEELLLGTISSAKNFGIVKKVIVFTKNTQAEIDAFFGSSDKYITLYGNEFINQKEYYSNLYQNIKLIYDNSETFNDRVLRKLLHIISPKWHSFREGRQGIILTAIQKELARSKKTQQKISGVAGSGKTQVLATRAINAQKRTGGNILILTYNITLANYLRQRLNEIREDFPWDKIKVIHYHHFIRLQASKCELRVSLTSYNNEDFFQGHEKEVDTFSAIFIDEVQDYETSWLKILESYFLEKGGEFVVFGDPKQNIYHRSLDTNGDIRLNIIGGQWNRSLKDSKRFANPSLAKLAMQFQKRFFENIPTDDIQANENKSKSINFNITSYVDMRNESDMLKIIDKCHNTIQANGLEMKDVVILGATTAFLRSLDYTYRLQYKIQTETSFIHQEQYQKLLSIHENLNANSQADWKLNRDLEALERIRKYHFSTIRPRLKISTIQSFKGWESPAVILILEKEQKSKEDFQPYSHEAFYTALTRAREHLFVLNLGNDEYHDFLTNELN